MVLKNLPYNPLKDFIPVAPLTSQPYVLVAGKSSGITAVSELIAAAKGKPGELKFGFTDTGTGTPLGLDKKDPCGPRKPARLAVFSTVLSLVG